MADEADDTEEEDEALSNSLRKSALSGELEANELASEVKSVLADEDETDESDPPLEAASSCEACCCKGCKYEPCAPNDDVSGFNEGDWSSDELDAGQNAGCGCWKSP